MSPYFICACVSVPILFIYLIGAVKHLSDQEENTCEMTYMYQYPQYVHIQLLKEIEEKFPKYRLYAYGEGFTVGRIRSHRFYGIPVLFIPGNAGSHHQVRSLASVSLRKSLKARTSFDFDFFTVDLHEEYSALYGGVFTEQTEFVSHSIQKILSFYSGKVDSVMLIGHSMGGIVSKGVLLEPTMNISQVNTIIMLATPHSAALVPDFSMATVYQKIEESEQIFKDSNVITISIGGGPRDVVVNSNQVVDQMADLNVLTTHIPGVWRSTDHLCILWCKELVLPIIRALFDSVDTSKKYPCISLDKEHRLKVFNYHFLQRSAGKKMGQYQAKVQFEPGSEWIEDIRRQYTWTATDRTGSNYKSDLYLMIRLIGRQDRLTIVTINLNVRDWLFACSAYAIQGHSRVCEWGWNLTNKSRIFPDATQKKKTVDLDLEELKELKLTHVVIRIPFYYLNREVSIGVDLHEKSERRMEFKNKLLPSLWQFQKIGVLSSGNAVVRYEVVLENNVDSVLLKLNNVTCNRRNHHHSAAIELLEPWINGISQLRLFTYQDETPKVFKIQTHGEVRGLENLSPVLKFTLDPQCIYTIEVWHGGVMEFISTTVRDRWSNLYGVIVGLLLLALAKQVDHELGFINSTRTTTITLVLCFGVGIGPEGFIALAILNLFSALLCCTIVFFGSTICNMAHRFLACATKVSVTWSEWIVAALNQLPLLTATILLSIVPITCGALSMLLFVALQFYKLTKLYEDYLEQLLFASLRFFFINKFRKQTATKIDEKQERPETDIRHIEHIKFQLVLFLVWCAAAIPAIPSILVWAQNYRYSARLTTEDPFLKICWMILVSCGSAGINWLPPTTPGCYSQEIATILRLLGWSALTITGMGYPTQYQYSMPPLITAGISLLAIRPAMQSDSIVKQ